MLVRNHVVIAAFALFLVAGPSVAAPFDDCRAQLPFGVPTLTEAARTTAICHKAYAVLVDDARLIPRWVAYRLTGEHTFGCIKRTNNFHHDDGMPADKRAEPSDYKKSGYDQGHHAPAQDFAWAIDVMRDSFSMANMAPQLHSLNGAQWERLEETVRAWAWKRKELIVYVGSVWDDKPQTIGTDHVAVPSGFWKVVVDPSTGEAIAFYMRHEATPKGPLEPFRKSVADIEDTAHITLPLPAGVDRQHVAVLWASDRAGWSKRHATLCSASKKSKKKNA